MRLNAKRPVAAATAIGAEKASLRSDGNSIPQSKARVSAPAGSKPTKLSKKRTWLLARVHELHRVLAARARVGQITDMDSAALVVADALTFLRSDGAYPTDRLFGRIDYETALRAIHSVEHLIETKRGGRYKPISNAEVGRRLQLTAIERDELGLRHIDPVDEAKRVRLARQKERRRADDRQRKREERAGKHKPQHESLEKAAPWKAMGIDRRTWFRREAKRRAQEGVTGLSELSP